MSKAIKDIVEGFHLAVDRGLPMESASPALVKKFRSWVKNNHPEIYEASDADSLEGYLIDEHEGVAPIVEFFKTVPVTALPAIFKDFRRRIQEYYSNSMPLDPNDEMQKAAIVTLKKIEKFLA